MLFSKMTFAASYWGCAGWAKFWIETSDPACIGFSKGLGALRVKEPSIR